jgi:hypothetical protein
MKADKDEVEKLLSGSSDVDKMCLSIARATTFEQNNEKVPDEADKFINDHYHIYGAEYEKRHLLEDLVMKEFNIDRLTASCWITYSTT